MPDNVSAKEPAMRTSGRVALLTVLLLAGAFTALAQPSARYLDKETFFQME